MKHAIESSTFPSCRTSLVRWPKFLSLLVLVWAALVSQASAQTYGLSNTWTQIAAATPTTNNIDTANNTRGMCYYAASNQVLVNNKSTHIITLYDGTLGASNGFISYPSLTGGNFTVNKIGFGTDGILYGANLQTAVSGSSPYKLYSWTNFGTAAYLAYSTTGSDAIGVFTATNGSIRVGDTWAITGGGTNTMILAGVNTKNLFVLLSTPDGVNFTPTVLTVPTLPTPGSGVQFGIAFYTNNTFLVNPDASGGSESLYLVQFPSNFASLSSPVTATILATDTGLAGDWLDLSYDAASGLLATHGNATTNITLYSLPSTNFAALASLSATGFTFSTSTSINGNETGDVALGGTGLTNAIYTLDTSAGLQATAIIFTAAAIAPSITTEPAGGAVFTTLGSFSFSVAATGTLPLAYQWQYNTVSNQATAANIAGATNASFTLSNLSVTNTGWYDVLITNTGGVTSSIPVLLTVSAPISSIYVSNLWSIAPSNGTGYYPYLDSTSYDTRGLAYDTNTMTVLVCDKGSDLGIYVLDANTGSNYQGASPNYQLNTIGIGYTGDQFNLDQVGVGDDGVVYACNLYDTGSTAGTFGIFAWSSVDSNALPYAAYGPSDPSGPGGQDRWGDTMAVRGAGTNTQLLFGTYFGFDSGPSTNASLFTTSDGVDFNPTLLVVTNVAVPAGFSSLGIAFGAGNTFWAKSPGYDLRQISFDPATGNCSVIQDIPAAANGAAAFSSMSAICLDVKNNLLAGVTFNDVPNDLSLFVLGTGTNTAPYLFDQAFFPSNNGNSQDNGATAVKYPRIYSLDVNNGIVALTYSVPLVPFSITSVSDTLAAGVILKWQSVSNRTYQVQFASALSGTTWTNLGSPIVAVGATTTYDDTSTNASRTTGYYRVLGH